MDNHYVPNLTFGPMICRRSSRTPRRRRQAVPIDVHLMVQPVDALAAGLRRGRRRLHQLPPRCVRRTCTAACRPSRPRAARPAWCSTRRTPLDVLDWVIEDIDLILIMSVNPGFGGQSFIDSALRKIEQARKRIDASGRDIRLEVDGGIKGDNIARVARPAPTPSWPAAPSSASPNLQGAHRRMRHAARPDAGPVIHGGAVEEEQFGLDLGATDYITKPISPPVLLARVRLHLERSANAKRLKTLSDQLSRYLAPQVYQSLFDGSRQAEIQTQRKRLTVFFSDIKNFTASTAQWQPEEVTFLLNSYFEEMSQIAAEYGATLDKFIGDAIVIFFGDPHTLGPRQDAVQCVRMAVAMQQRMGELRQRWKDMGIHKAFEIRIGINSGFCDVGNFGSNLRMDYTIIGREVNLAARLEQAAEPGEILMSRDTHDLVQDDIEVEARKPVIAKGFTEPITVYAVRQVPFSPPRQAARRG
jgi:ribulose-phosphate 3-epimerase